MSIAQGESEHLQELYEHEPKIINQQTTKFCLTQTSPSPSLFDFEASIHHSTDTSFECTMHQDNLENVREAADRLLEDCLHGPYDKLQGFSDPSLYPSQTTQFKDDNELESLVVHNELLNHEMVREMGGMLEREEGLVGLLLQALKTFGLTVGKEIVYVIYCLLHQKLEEFRKLMPSKEPIIPKMNCFQDCGQDFLTQLTTSCPVYEEVSLEEVIAFAERDVDHCAHELYFSRLKILNLREVTCECKREVSLVDKFVRLVRQISKTVFLTVIGATEPVSTRGLMGVDLSREISLAQFSEFSIQKSLSRPFLALEEEESYDFVSKKIKFQ